MTKDVLISISGLQYDIDENETVEVVTPGKYYFKNNKHYLLYDEYLDESSNEVTKNKMIISNDQISIIKTGATSAQMQFEPGKECISYYNTPMGQLEVAFATSKVNTTYESDLIDININYGLSINRSHISDCNITMQVTPSKI
ncbi:MAG: DUF1934 domain-containing protein [Lachnospiraceae bacterium]|nr:DUF1934 domain-containing protein [Lachnospiraceae bacterium]